MSQEAPDRFDHENFESNRKLDALFAEYREACPDVEPSANFMPNIWARIQSQEAAQRGWMWHLSSYAKRMALATAAACMLLVGMHIGSTWKTESLLSQSYVDVLQDSAATEDYAYVPVVDQGGNFQ